MRNSGEFDRVMADARQRLAGLSAPRIVVAAANERTRLALADAVAGIAPGLRCERLANAEELELASYHHGSDLVILDIEFAGADPLGPSFWAILGELEAHSPRPSVVVVHSGAIGADERKAFERHARVRSLVDWAAKDAAVLLVQASVEALLWTQRRRDAARELGRQADPAAWVAAFRSGDLAGEALKQCQENLKRSIAQLSGATDLGVELLRVAIQDRYDQLDEVGLVYFATLMRDHYPQVRAEADDWLMRAGTILGKVYGLLDLDLDSAAVQWRLGNYARVVESCESALARMGNVIPATLLKAEALRMLGSLEEAIEVYFAVAEMALRNGEVERYYQLLRTIGALDAEGVQTDRLNMARARAQRLEEEHSDPAAVPRLPVLRVCTRGLCQDAAEASGGFYSVDPELDGCCDICDLGLKRSDDREILAGYIIAVIGGRLPEAYERVLYELGAKNVLCFVDGEDASGIPALVQAADGVVLVTGASVHAVNIKAERELSRHPRPYVRVHFYGPKQVARAAAMDLAPRLGGAKSRKR